MSRKLIVLDVDSTLIEQEVIELLASFAGKSEEVQAVTERAMAGELDFTGSLKARVKTLTNMPEGIIAEALAQVQYTEGAKELIEYIKSKGSLVAAVSGGFNQLLEPIALDLGLDFYRANELEIVNGVLTGDVLDPIIDKPAKATALREWAAQSGIEISNTVAIGDGANDIDMLECAGLGIGFNAKPRVRAVADVLIDSGNLADAIELLGL